MDPIIKPKQFLYALILLIHLVAGVFLASPVAAGIVYSGTAVVDLRAADYAGNPATWTNHGNGGTFTAYGTAKPAYNTVGGAPAVTFVGGGDPSRFECPPAPVSVTGTSAWSVEAWVYDSEALAFEEDYFQWGARNAGVGAAADLCYSAPGPGGSNLAYVHWGADGGFANNTPPAINQWHLITLTYAGGTNGDEKLYVDGMLQTTTQRTLNISRAINMIIGTGWQFGYGFINRATLSIGALRLEPGVLSAADVANNFLNDASSYSQTNNVRTLVYDRNGATGGDVPADSNSQYVTGTTVTVTGNPGNLTNDGYSFVGWNTLANGTGTLYVAGNTFAITADTTLYAQWVPLNTYATLYIGNGNTDGSVPVDPNNPYISGAIVTVLGNTGSLTRTGYTFTHWNTAAVGDGTSYAPGDTFAINATTTLYAQWTINQYTLNYAAGANGSLTGTLSQTVNYGGSGTQVTAVPDDGYLFVNWSDGLTTASRTDANVSADLTVTANFAPQDLTWDGAAASFSTAHWNPGPIAWPGALFNAHVESGQVDIDTHWNVKSLAIANATVGVTTLDGADPFGVPALTPITLNPGGVFTTAHGSHIGPTTLTGGTLAGTGSIWGTWWFKNNTLTATGGVTSTVSAINLVLENGTTNTFHVDSGSTLDVTGNFGGGANYLGSGVLVKSGPGLMTLSGGNRYPGATVVNEGTLNVTGSLGASAVQVKAGATLAGSGPLGGDLTIESGGHHALAVAPTPAAQVTRTVAGAMTLTAGNILDLTASAAPAPGVYTLVTATGGITGTPTTVNLTGLTGATSVVNGNQLQLTVSHYDAWAQGFPGFTDTAPAHDPDGDSLTNLQEYAFGMNPTASYSGPIEYNATDVTTAGIPKPLEEGGMYYAVFGRRADYLTSGVHYTVQFSADLNDGYWVTSATEPTELTTTGTIHAVRVPYPGLIDSASGPQKARFFRVGVSQTTP